MQPLLIFVFLYLAGTISQTEANPTLEDAVGYLLVLADDSNQNGYTIQPGSSHVQQFNSQYERVDASGITGEQGRQRLVEACNAVIENIKFFDEGSPLGGILIEQFERTQVLSVIRILGKPNESVNSRSKAGELVCALFKMDKVCHDLSLHSNVGSSNPTLRDAMEYLLAYHTARQTGNQIGNLVDLVLEACHVVADNLHDFDPQSQLAQIVMEKFGSTKVHAIIKMLKMQTVPSHANSNASKIVLALQKMNEVCKLLFV